MTDDFYSLGSGLRLGASHPTMEMKMENANNQLADCVLDASGNEVALGELILLSRCLINPDGLGSRFLVAWLNSDSEGRKRAERMIEMAGLAFQNNEANEPVEKYPRNGRAWSRSEEEAIVIKAGEARRLTRGKIMELAAEIGRKPNSIAKHARKMTPSVETVEG